MANLVETIQKNLGYGELNKIDPNTQDINTDVKIFGANALAQAAIPTILCGLFSHLENRKTIPAIFESDTANWFSVIFGDKKNEVLEKIAGYAGTSLAVARQEAEHIANEAVRIIRESLPDKENYNAISTFVAANKNTALLYLPAAMQIGQLLDNNNLDDKTNKMEGPVSSFMHKIEQQFNSGE